MVKPVSALAKAASRTLLFPCTDPLRERIYGMMESQKALSERVVRARETWLTELDWTTENLTLAGSGYGN